MPGLDGISRLRQMRFLGWGGRAALITAYRSPKLEAEAALTGYELIIDKPVRGQHLLDTVTRLTARPTIESGEGSSASCRECRPPARAGLSGASGARSRARAGMHYSYGFRPPEAGRASGRERRCTHGLFPVQPQKLKNNKTD